MPSAKFLIRISADRLYAKNLQNGQVFDEAAMVAFADSTKKTAIAISDASARADAVYVWPFREHPRLLLSDFTAAEALLKYAVRRLTPSLSLFAPDFIVEVTRPLEGGIGAIELRALEELCQAAGARRMLYLAPGAMNGLTPEEAEQKLRGM
ncbi:MAG: rod shape-determining protein [Micavibrio sp.]|nr:rod shape-determining protein [Micavibrio sp.]